MGVGKLNTSQRKVKTLTKQGSNYTEHWENVLSFITAGNRQCEITSHTPTHSNSYTHTNRNTCTFNIKNRNCTMLTTGQTDRHTVPFGLTIGIHTHFLCATLSLWTGAAAKEINKSITSFLLSRFHNPIFHFILFPKVLLFTKRAAIISHFCSLYIIYHA